MENSRISTCRGCQARESGLKSRIAIPHTCGLEPKSSMVKGFCDCEAPLPLHGHNHVTCQLCHKPYSAQKNHNKLYSFEMPKRKLPDIMPEEMMEIASMLIPIAFESGQTHAPGWKVVPYSELGIEFQGFRVKHKYNDFYVDFDTDVDEIKVGNDTKYDDIAIDAKTWFSVVQRLNEMGIFHEWQVEPKNPGK